MKWFKKIFTKQSENLTSLDLAENINKALYAEKLNEPCVAVWFAAQSFIEEKRNRDDACAIILALLPSLTEILSERKRINNIDGGECCRLINKIEKENQDINEAEATSLARVVMFNSYYSIVLERLKKAKNLLANEKSPSISDTYKEIRNVAAILSIDENSQSNVEWISKFNTVVSEENKAEVIKTESIAIDIAVRLIRSRNVEEIVGSIEGILDIYKETESYQILADILNSQNIDYYDTKKILIEENTFQAAKSMYARDCSRFPGLTNAS